MFLLRAICLLSLVVLSLGSAISQTEDPNLIIFREGDALFIFIPASQPTSLEEVRFEITDGDNQTKSYGMRDFPAFRGINFFSIQNPTCFVLRKGDSRASFPMDCLSNAELHIQNVNTADLFWYDESTNQSYLITVLQGAQTIGQCPASAPECRFSLSTQSGIESDPTATGPQEVSDLNDWTPVSEIMDGVEMVLVPAGCFTMGSTQSQIDQMWQQCEEFQGPCQRTWFEDQSPQAEVCFENAFWIDRYEVTNAQYQKCVIAGVCNLPAYTLYYNDPAYAEHPVLGVNWSQAQTYAAWRGGQLPSEAQWEYAARGSSDYIYPWGNTFDASSLNFCDKRCSNTWAMGSHDDGFAQTSPVGSYPLGESWVGAMDLSGNVWEWTNSLYRGYPYNALDGRELATDTNSPRVMRGGSWYDHPAFTTATFRGASDPTQEATFRVVIIDD